MKKILEKLANEISESMHLDRRQFSRYISSSRVSPTRSAVHLNGIFPGHTNQSNLNRFLRNIPVQEIFRKSVSLINRYSSVL